MKSFATLSILAFQIAASQSISDNYDKDPMVHRKTQSYLSYLAKYGKSYNNVNEFNSRHSQYDKTDAFIQEWMSDHVSKVAFIFHEEKLHTHTVAHNKFSDWYDHEMDALLVREENSM